MPSTKDPNQSEMQNASLSVFVSIRVCLSALQMWIIFTVGLACDSWQQFVSVGPSWSSTEAQPRRVLYKLHAVCVRCTVMVTYDLLKSEKRAPWPELISLCPRWPSRISFYKVLISRTTSLALQGHKAAVSQHCSCCGYSLQQTCSDTFALHPL